MTENERITFLTADLKYNILKLDVPDVNKVIAIFDSFMNRLSKGCDDCYWYDNENCNYYQGWYVEGDGCISIKEEIYE